MELESALDDAIRIKEEVAFKRRRQDEVSPVIQVYSLALTDLVKRHQQLEMVIDRANVPIAPIRKLPVETLSYIFEFCALKDENAPLLVSRVCRKWRTAATSPQIWSRVVIDLDDFHAPEKAAMFLRRSRNTLIDIELRRIGYNDSGWEAWYCAIAHSHRWRSLEITASTSEQVNDIMDELPFDAPNFIHITITVEGTHLEPSFHHGPARLEFPPDFADYPNFCSLHIRMWCIPEIAQNPCSVLLQLTTLHLTDTYATTFRVQDPCRPHPICGNAIASILSFCPNLRTFTFDARDSVDHRSGTFCQELRRGEYTLPSLQHIQLIAHHFDTFAVLNRLVLPSLCTAHVEPLPRYHSGLTEAFGTTWCDLLRRSKAPPLEKLYVSAMAPQDMIWTLERSPRLKQFSLAYCANPSSVIDALAAPYAYKGRGRFNEEHRWVCPKLSRISLEECFCIPWKGVARLIQNRHRAYRDEKKLALMVNLVINGHYVFEDRDLDSLATFKLRHIATLIEP